MTKERYFELLNSNTGFTSEDIKDVNETLKKAVFIGRDGKDVESIIIEATSNGEAFCKARQIYKDNGWTFRYSKVEINDCL